MIDLHCHILPGLDDGPADIEETVSLARFAAADGTRTIVATPHVREDYPFDLWRIAHLTHQVNDRLARDSVPIKVEPGAEVAVSMLTALDDATLATICIGSSRSILVESPYQQVTDLLEQALFDVQLRGFRPVLAHPERSPSFMSDPDRLATLVDRGVLCSVTSASMAGRFGRTVQRFARLLLERDLVHDVASDAHDVERRSPGLSAGFRLLGRDVPGLLDQMDWYTSAMPEAILSGGRLPPRPVIEPARRRFLGYRSKRAR